MPAAERVILGLVLALTFGGVSAAAEDAGPPAPAPAPAQATDADARAAVQRFDEDSKSPSAMRRLDAATRLGKLVHPLVANALMVAALDESRETRVRTAAFCGLGRQTPLAKVLGPVLSKFLAGAAEDNRKRKARGDYGVRIDPKTGDVDTTSVEGKAALLVKRERGQMLCEAVRALEALGYRQRDSVETLAGFLSDGCDDLVAAAIAAMGAWREWSVLPDLLDLYETYPTEDRVNVGSVHDEHGDNQSAKRAWMARYGDPDRRRPRPVLVRALKAALTSITGEAFEEPGVLREYLRRPEVKRRVKAR